MHNALIEGKDIGANTVQFFTANQRTWHTKPLSEEAVLLWEKARDETGIEVIMSHDSYLINLGSPDKEILAKSRKAFRQELERCLLLGVTYLNFHPGAYTTGTLEEGLDTIIESLLEIAPLANTGKTRLLLETTAGQGSCMGSKFEEIAYLIRETHKTLPIGVCIDTCHIFAAGYDIRTKEGFNKTIEEFDETIGLSNLYAFHVNDSLKPLGSRADRHASLGKGLIGLPCFEALMQHEKLSHMPKYLETPDHTIWPEEIALLGKFREAISK